eukprot:9210467-Pyramimonas_sp.AAC.1
MSITRSRWRAERENKGARTALKHTEIAPVDINEISVEPQWNLGGQSELIFIMIWGLTKASIGGTSTFTPDTHTSH